MTRRHCFHGEHVGSIEVRISMDTYSGFRVDGTILQRIQKVVCMDPYIQDILSTSWGLRHLL